MSADTATFLVIRRDNIGDLVCTTPLVRALRAHHPAARICALVTTYNVAVLQHDPDVDAVYCYTKLKHRAPGAGALGILWRRVKLLWRLRRERFDYAIVAGSGPQLRAARFAHLIGARHVIGYVDSAAGRARGIDIAVPAPRAPTAEVEAVFRLLGPLGIHGTPPAMRVVPDPVEVEAARRKLERYRALLTARVIGVHISTRKPSNRWPDENYIELIRRLHAASNAAFLLLWAPGDAANPRHPGDDAGAAAIKLALPGVPLIAYPMGPLAQLIADLSLCDVVITSDGGAMHIAAALGKPLLCFFGDTDATRWRPWGVAHVLLQPPSRAARDIGVDEAVDGFNRVLDLTRASSGANGRRAGR